MHTLLPGKRRGLQACATPQGIFTILAADHRDSLRAVIAPESPAAVTAAQLTELKLAVVEHLAPLTSAMLLDPVFSAGQAIAEGRLPGQVGLVCAIEEQGYLSDPYRRQTPLIAGWSVEKTRRMGANGIKLLLFYHPDTGEAAEAQERLVRSVANDCRRYEVPFFLEPIVYSIDPDVKKGTPQFATQRRHIVVETMRRLSGLGPDVMKVEFPLDVQFEPDQAVWAEACAELNEAARVPWTILSAGVSIETFKEQVRLACQAGCSGFVGGRAIWQEAAGLHGEERANFLATVARRRLKELNEIALESGVPWTTWYPQAPVDESWYQQY